MKDFKDHVAVITGGASGIGRAMADRFAAEGMKIVLADVEEGTLDSARKELVDAGADVLTVVADVSKAAEVKALSEKTLDKFGGVHIVCNNAGALREDNNKFRKRIRAGLDALSALPETDTDRMAVIGYCMGGTCSLEMARDGAPVRGVVSFHGALETTGPAKAGKVGAKILVCHGADDPFVPVEQVNAFEAEMTAAGANWQVISYGNTVHSFTNPEADGSIEGICYNQQADERSWQAMRAFFAEIFE